MKQRVHLQRKKIDDRERESVPPIVHETLASEGQPLDTATRAFLEPRFGHDFGRVRVHTDARAADSAEAVNALAYTVGQDIAFGAGQYQPGTGEGRRLIAHELAHVVQQASDVSARGNLSDISYRSQQNGNSERAATLAAMETALGQNLSVDLRPAAVSLVRQPRTSDTSVPRPVSNQEDQQSRTEGEARSSRRLTSSSRRVEQILRQLPVSTPEEVNIAREVLTRFLELRNAAIEGGTPLSILPIAAIPLNVVELVEQIRAEQYWDAAVTLVELVGDVALTASWLIEAAIELGAISSTIGGIANAGTMLGLLGEAAGPLAIALAVAIAGFRVPGEVNEELYKAFFITNFSGVITSWIFHNDTISPHTHLLADAQSDESARDILRQAVWDGHEAARTLWQANYQEQPEQVRQAQQSVNGDYRVYWLQLGRALEARPELRPRTAGFASALIRDLIRGAERRRDDQRRQRQHDEDVRRHGQVVRTADGLDLYLPPAGE